MYTPQEGNHRVHALKKMCKMPLHELPLWLRDDLLDYKLPLNIYTSDMPDDMCMRFGRLMNELQSFGDNANFLDDVRFILNLKEGLPEVSAAHTHTPTHTSTHTHTHTHPHT
jgi:hypothetical protein